MRYASRLQHYLALKNEIFSSADFHSGTARANAKSVLILNTVRFCAFEIFSRKTENFRQEKRYASR
jgi:hypothetical protein